MAKHYFFTMRGNIQRKGSSVEAALWRGQEGTVIALPHPRQGVKQSET